MQILRALHENELPRYCRLLYEAGRLLNAALLDKASHGNFLRGCLGTVCVVSDENNLIRDGTTRAIDVSVFWVGIARIANLAHDDPLSGSLELSHHIDGKIETVIGALVCIEYEKGSVFDLMDRASAESRLEIGDALLN